MKRYDLSKLKKEIPHLHFVRCGGFYGVASACKVILVAPPFYVLLDDDWGKYWADRWQAHACIRQDITPE